MSKMPYWMSELYTLILRFNIPMKELMPYKRPLCNEWAFMRVGKRELKRYSKLRHKPLSVQDFIDKLQEL